jgi:hypothetical protein
MSWYSPRTTLRSVFYQYFQYGFWKVAVIRKHKIPGSWRHAVPVTFVVMNLALLAGAAIAMWVGSAWWAAAALLWAAMFACYGVANLVASVAAARSAGWDLLPYLPAAFATYHFAWGLGFLVGIFRMLPKPGAPIPIQVNSTFTKLTR